MGRKVVRYPVEYLDGLTRFRYSEATGELLEEISPEEIFYRANLRSIPDIPASYGANGIRVNFNEDSGAITSYDIWEDEEDIEPPHIKPKKLKEIQERIQTSLIRLPEAARYIGVSEGTLRRWVKKGKLPYRQPGRAYLFTKEDLESFIESEKRIKAPNNANKTASGISKKPDCQKIIRNLKLGGNR